MIEWRQSIEGKKRKRQRKIVRVRKHRDSGLD